MKKYVRLRHRFFFWALRPIGYILARKLYFKTKKAKLDKKQNYFILSNHQGYLDPALMALTIHRPIYFVASDALYSKKWYLRLLFYCFGPIKKRKGFADVGCIRRMCKTAQEGGTVAVFPEGNRQWNDSMFSIDKSIVKLVRMLKLPLILYNFRGGYGVQPRWGKSIRKGKHIGEINRIVSWEDISAMSDHELYQTIISALKVIDSDSGELYKSDERAEYLERQLFVCPKCSAASTLVSHDNDVVCTNCGLTVTYGEDLHLTSPDPDFKFDKVVDWYEFQQQYVLGYDLETSDVLLSDDSIELYDKTEQKRMLVAQGTLSLTKDALTVGDMRFSTSDISGFSGQDGDKFSFNIGNKSYLVIGPERFNGVKYMLFFNRVCEQIQEQGGDKYYGLYLNPDLR